MKLAAIDSCSSFWQLMERSKKGGARGQRKIKKLKIKPGTGEKSPVRSPTLLFPLAKRSQTFISFPVEQGAHIMPFYGFRCGIQNRSTRSFYKWLKNILVFGRFFMSKSILSTVWSIHEQFSEFLNETMKLFLIRTDNHKDHVTQYNKMPSDSKGNWSAAKHTADKKTITCVVNKITQ